MRDTLLEKQVEIVRSICHSLNSLRKQNNRNQQISLGNVMVYSNNQMVLDSVAQFMWDIVEETNSDLIGFRSMDDCPFAKLEIKANYRCLGKKFGNKTKDIVALIESNFNLIQKAHSNKETDIQLSDDVSINLNDDLFIKSSVDDESVIIINELETIIHVDLNVSDEQVKDSKIRTILKQIVQKRRDIGAGLRDEAHLLIKSKDKEFVSNFVKEYLFYLKVKLDKEYGHLYSVLDMASQANLIANQQFSYACVDGYWVFSTLYFNGCLPDLKINEILDSVFVNKVDLEIDEIEVYISLA